MITIEDMVVKIFDETTYNKIIPDYELNLLLKITADIILNADKYFFDVVSRSTSIPCNYSDHFLSKKQRRNIVITKIWEMKITEALHYANNHLAHFKYITNTAVFSGLVDQLNDSQKSIVKCLVTACYNAGIYYIHKIYNWKFTRDLSLVECNVSNFIKSNDLIRLYELIYSTIKSSFISPIDFMILCFNSLIEILNQLLKNNSKENKNQNKKTPNKENKKDENKIELTNDDIKTALDKVEDNVEKFKNEINDVLEYEYSTYNAQKEKYINQIAHTVADVDAIRNSFDLVENLNNDDDITIFGPMPRLLTVEEHHLVSYRKDEYNFILKKSKESLVDKIRSNYAEFMQALSKLEGNQLSLKIIYRHTAREHFVRCERDNELLKVIGSLGKIKKRLKILGEEYYNEINKHKNIKSSKYEYIPITSASDLVRAPAYQLAHPKLKEKFENEQVYGLLPYSEKIKKQSLIILLDDSGSMCDYYKMDIVNYIMDNYIKLVKENKCQFIFYLFCNNRYSRIECTKPEHCEEFRMRFNSWDPSKGVTSIDKIIQETIDEVSAMESTDKPEILIINDGQDLVQPDKIIFNNVRINSIVVGGILRNSFNNDFFAINFKTNEFISLLKDSEVIKLYEDITSNKTKMSLPNKSKKPTANEKIKLIEEVNNLYSVTLLPKLTKGYLIFI